MARIAVVTSSPPFVDGGHLVIARELVRALQAAGHGADLIVTPQNRFGRQGAAYLATWLTDVGLAADGQPIDQVISLRYPAFAVRHPRHVLWLTHLMREYYDLWDEWSAGLSWKNRIKEGARRALMHRADRYLLHAHCQRRFVIAGVVQRRLQRWGGIQSEVLHPPAPARAYRCDGYGDYVFAVSRLEPLKRFDLLLRALATPEAAGARCVIGGDGPDRPRLAALRDELGLRGRVELVGRLDEATLLDHLARCRAVVFPPHDEDYGFVTVEAFASAKAVVTCSDSGGPTELVHDGLSGVVTAPEPAALGAAIGRLSRDAGLAEELGAGGRRAGAAMSWRAAVDRLVLPDVAARPV
jgi:glycosyltransferase involved in cell wall biosynthesis